MHCFLGLEDTSAFISWERVSPECEGVGVGKGGDRQTCTKWLHLLEALSSVARESLQPEHPEAALAVP